MGKTIRKQYKNTRKSNLKVQNKKLELCGENRKKVKDLVLHATEQKLIQNQSLELGLYVTPVKAQVLY